MEVAAALGDQGVALGSPISATAVAANGTLYVATGTRLFATAMKTTPTVR